MHTKIYRIHENKTQPWEKTQTFCKATRRWVQYLWTSNVTGASIHGFQGLQNNCTSSYIKTVPAKSWKCCITLSKLFLHGFKSSRKVKNLNFALKMCVFFWWKAGNLYACEDAKQRNYFKQPYKLLQLLGIETIDHILHRNKITINTRMCLEKAKTWTKTQFPPKEWQIGMAAGYFSLLWVEMANQECHLLHYPCCSSLNETYLHLTADLISANLHSTIC